MNTHFVTTEFTGGMAFNAVINSHPVIMDTLKEEGGLNTGPSPKRLMLASLAGCTGMDIVSILNKMKVPFSDFSIDTNAAVAEEYPKMYNHVKLTYKIKLSEANKSKMLKAVNLSQQKYCSVSAMFRTFAKLETEIIYL